MKTFNPFQSETEYARFDDKYTFGLECEFYAEEDYFDKVWYSDNAILGIDGAGKPTGEYRSPIFKSTIPRIAVGGGINFTNKVLSAVYKNYNTVFAPVLYYNEKNACDCSSCRRLRQLNGGLSKRFHSFGIHFSLGGKFLSDGKFSERYSRAQEVQENLVNVVEDQNLYLQREKGTYNGKFTGCECNAVRVKDCKNSADFIRRPEEITLIEFRFLPSCDFKTVVPYLRYILLGGDLPKSTIKFLNIDKAVEEYDPLYNYT